MSKKNNTNANLNTKIDKGLKNVNTRINKVEANLGSTNNTVSQMQERMMYNDLVPVTFPGSNIYVYTHQQIADNHGVTKYRVEEIARKHNLIRKNVRPV